MAEKEEVSAPVNALQLSRVLSKKEGQKAEADNRSVSSSESEQNSKRESPAGDYPTSFKLAFIIIALICSMFLVALDMTIIATAIPRITDAFHSVDQVGW
jgi:hypothetical protein